MPPVTEMGIDSPSIGGSGSPTSRMGISGPSHRSLGGDMGMPLRGLTPPTVAPNDSGETGDAEDLADGDHVLSGASEEDRDGPDQEHPTDDDDAPVDKERASESRIVRKLRMRSDELRTANSELRALRREKAAGQWGGPQHGQAGSGLDRKDPTGSIKRMAQEMLGPKATEADVRQWLKEAGTDMLLEAQPEFANDPKYRTRMETRRQRLEIEAEKAELTRLAAEARDERERGERERVSSANKVTAQNEVTRFLKAEGEAYPYLAGRPDGGSAELLEVLDEMADSREHDFSPGPNQGRRVADGFRIAASRLEAYHKREAETYARAKAGRDGRKAGNTPNSQSGRVAEPGKRRIGGQERASGHQTTTAKQASRTGTRGPSASGHGVGDDEPTDPRLKFSDFVTTQKSVNDRNRRR